MLAPLLSLTLLAAPNAAPLKVAVMPLAAGEGVAEKTADAVSEGVAAELRRLPGLQIITRQAISAALSIERQRQLLACSSDSCAAEIAGALDVDRVVTGSVAKLGESWVVHLQLLDARKALTVGFSDRRKRGGSIDDVLDAIPGMARELFPGGASAPAAPQVAEAPPPLPPAPPPVALPAPKVALPRPWAEEPMDTSEVKAKLAWVTDGKGSYLVFVPYALMEQPLFSGDGKTLHAQRVFGSGSDEGSKQFSANFWEPRVRAPAEGMFERKGDTYTLTCGRNEIAFKEVPAAQARTLMKSARFLKVRWQRRAYALARDDEGTYFYVDRAREPDGNQDFHLFIGTQGEMVGQPAKVLASDDEGDVFGTPEGKLRLAHQRQEAEWIQGTIRRKLRYLPVEDNAKLIYTSLGAYKGERLGTPCDGRL